MSSRRRPASRRGTPVLALTITVLCAAAVLAACSSHSSSTPVTLSPAARKGQALAGRLGCAGCHTANGHSSIGPTWQGLWGSTVSLSDGTSVVVDAAYVKRSIAHPKAQVVKGFKALMPPFTLTDAQVAELTAYLKALR